MRKIIFLLLLLLICNTMYSQKKKAVKSMNSTILAKTDLVSAEFINNNFYLFQNNKELKKDTLFSKSFEPNKKPLDCKVLAYKVKEITLYCVTWSENSINETKEKTEDKTQLHTEIWEVNSKNLALSNIQTMTKIKEIVYLDKLKNASETREKIRREGLEFVLTQQGEVLLKSKTQETKMIYDLSTKKYAESKKKK